MTKKRIFRWLLGLFLVGILVVVACFLLRDTFARLAVQRAIENQTHLKTTIGRFHIDPQSVTIKDLKLYNPSNFGGTLFLAIPEISFEFDREAAWSKHEIHLTVVRFNLGELDIVKNEAGQTNLYALGVTLPTKDQLVNSRDLNDLKKRTGYDFTGIDKLNVTVGTMKYIDLKDPQNNHQQNIGIDNLAVPNVKSPADLAGLLVLVVLRSGDFFTLLASPAAIR